MVYRLLKDPEDNRICYEASEDGERAAEFSYHTESLPHGAACRFWIDQVRLDGDFSDTVTMEAVLQFIQYKCLAAGCQAMFVRLDDKNLFYLELYRKFGFYMIDQEEWESVQGQTCSKSVLKYPIPESKDEAFRSYILRSERKRAKIQPK